MLKKILGLLHKQQPMPDTLHPIYPGDHPRLYIHLYHGRTSPDEDLHDWGTDGPFIGPLKITYTYGHIKIHDEKYEDMEFLPEIEGLVPFEGVYYGDFDICVLSNEDMHEIVHDGSQYRTAEQFLNAIRTERVKPNNQPPHGTDNL